MAKYKRDFSFFGFLKNILNSVSSLIGYIVIFKMLADGDLTNNLICFYNSCKATLIELIIKFL